MTTTEKVEKHHIPYEKLVIGPVTTVLEMLTGGHYMEMLKYTRQSGTYPSYIAASRHLWSTLGVSGLYKGFWPAGFVQGLYKGLPVLFVQGEMKYRLQNAGYSSKQSAVVSGICAGAVQGAMLAPTQRIKLMIATNKDAGAVSLDIVRATIAREGVATCFKGTGVMMARRGVDWGLRFYGADVARRWFMARKAEGEPQKLTLAESFGVGIFGGAFSAFNHPLDVWVANAQKHREVPATATEVLKELMAESRAKGFSKVWLRGIEMRIIHSSYHTAWMAGIGSWIFDQYRAHVNEK